MASTADTLDIEALPSFEDRWHQEILRSGCEETRNRTIVLKRMASLFDVCLLVSLATILQQRVNAYRR